jgi:hypothetical protein
MNLNRLCTKIEKTLRRDKPYANMPPKNLLKSIGFTYLSSGISRAVYVSKRRGLVLKIQYEGCAKNQNKTEVETYLSTPYPLKRLLLPILAWEPSNYLWVLTPYAKINKDFDKWKADAETISNCLALFNLNYADLIPANIGRLGQQLVIIDYGMGFCTRS